MTKEYCPPAQIDKVAWTPTEIVAWRASYLVNHAEGLEYRAAKLLAEAKEYREQAERLNPSSCQRRN